MLFKWPHLEGCPFWKDGALRLSLGLWKGCPEHPFGACAFTFPSMRCSKLKFGTASRPEISAISLAQTSYKVPLRFQVLDLDRSWQGEGWDLQLPEAQCRHPNGEDAGDGHPGSAEAGHGDRVARPVGAPEG